MSNELTPKIALLSAVYIIVLLVLGLLLNLGLGWLIDECVIPLINWYNHLAIVWEVLLFIIGGYMVFQLMLGTVKMVTNVIFILVFNRLPENNFTVITSFLIYLTNLSWLTYHLWEITPKFSFLIVLEFLVLFVFIASATSVLMPWYLKEKLRKQKQEQEMEEFMRRRGI